MQGEVFREEQQDDDEYKGDTRHNDISSVTVAVFFRGTSPHSIWAGPSWERPCHVATCTPSRPHPLVPISLYALPYGDRKWSGSLKFCNAR